MNIIEYISPRRVKCSCDGCGVSVEKWLSQVADSLHIFCTALCRNKNYKIASPDWRPSNCCEYRRICKHCQKEYVVTGTQSGQKKIFCSMSCKAAAQVGIKGVKHSEETKQKLSKSQKEYCAKHGNQFLTGKSAGKHTQETVIKISENNTGKPPQWKGRIFQYDGPQGSFKLRSSYELFYARWLDDQGIEWDYEPHFKLSNGKMFSPDFKLEDGVIIEIKGYWTKIGAEKWTLFCSDYSEIPKKVLMKSDLIKLGMKGK